MSEKNFSLKPSAENLLDLLHSTEEAIEKSPEKKYP